HGWQKVRRQSLAPAITRQSGQRPRRRRFEHQECFTESASHAGKAFFFSKERVSLVCRDFCARHRTWTVSAEDPLFDVSLLPDFLNILLYIITKFTIYLTA